MNNVLLKSERLILQAYLNLPANPLLKHQFDIEEGCLAGFVDRFLKGERFEDEFIIFTEEEKKHINSLVLNNYNNEDGKDLLTTFLLIQTVCNILNKYQKKRKL